LGCAITHKGVCFPHFTLNLKHGVEDAQYSKGN
jgi:hypothetical protein